jgi:hypothetical protein
MVAVKMTWRCSVPVRPAAGETRQPVTKRTEAGLSDQS